MHTGHNCDSAMGNEPIMQKKQSALQAAGHYCLQGPVGNMGLENQSHHEKAVGV